MSRWNSSDWPALVDGSGCPICIAGGPWDAVAALDASILTCPRKAPLRGYCCLVLKRHSVELHELGPQEAKALVADIQRVAKVVQRITGAVKLNYEIHGNTIPHLHVHLYPRQVGDPFENGPIDWRRAAQPLYAPGEHEAYVAELRALV